MHGAYANFRSQKFPRTEPIEKGERAAFESAVAELLPLLDGATESDESVQPERTAARDPEPGEKNSQEQVLR